MRRTPLPSIAAVSALLVLSVASLSAARRPSYGGDLRIEIRAAIAVLEPSATPDDPAALGALRQLTAANAAMGHLRRIHGVGTMSDPPPIATKMAGQQSSFSTRSHAASVAVGCPQGHHHRQFSLYRAGQGHRACFCRRWRLVYRSRTSCRRDVRSQGTDAWNVRKRRRPCKTASGPL